MDHENLVKHAWLSSKMQQVGLHALLSPATSDDNSSDKEYRRSIHHLEALRMQRVNVLQDGYNVTNDLKKNFLSG